MAVIEFDSAIDDPRGFGAAGFTTPEGAIDGSGSTFANSASGASWGDHFRALRLHLPTTSDIYSITTNMNYCGGGADPPMIQVSADGSSWTTVAVTSAPGPSGYRVHTLSTPAIGVNYVALADQGFGLHFWCWFQVFDVYADGDATPTPPPPPPYTVVINGVEFERLTEKKLRAELNGIGSFNFAIPKDDPQATAENIAFGNLVQVTIPQIHSEVLWEGLLEQGDFDLLSSDEEGGEFLSFSGPGILAYLRRAVLDFEQYFGARQEAFPEKGIWDFENSAGNRTEGDIIRRIIDEAQAAARPSDPIPLVTRTFTDDDDSAGVPWGDEALEGNWTETIGANLLDSVLRFARAGLLNVEMRPGFILDAFRDMGVDRTGSFGPGIVRFEKGVNIVDEVGKSMAGSSWATNAIVKKGNGDYVRAAISGTFPYEQEVYIEAKSSNTTLARREAQGKMRLREDAQEALIFAITCPAPGEATDESAGLYLPGNPAWTDNGLFWLGDLVTLHTGTGELDYNEETFRVYAITLYEDEVGNLAPPIVELNAPYVQPGESDLSPTAPTSYNPPASGGSGGTSSSHSHAGLQTVALVTISPDQLVANTNNWNPDGLSTADVIRISTDATRNLTGIVAAEVSRRLVLENVGTENLVLVHDATSTAANRFLAPNSENLTLGPNASVELVYDLTSERWRILDPSAGSATSISGGMVPYYIGPGETFSVPEFRQALYAMLIDVEGTLDVEGYLLEVD